MGGFRYPKTLFIEPKRIIIIWFISLVLFSCGKKTPPQPITQEKGSLPKISGFSLNYRGNQLVLRWEMPAGWEIIPPVFTFYAFPSLENCLSCKKQDLFSFTIDLADYLVLPINDKLVRIKGIETENWKEIWIREKNRISLFLTVPLLIEKKYFQLEYENQSGQKSPRSPVLEAFRSIPLLAPELHYVLLEDDNTKGSDQFQLLISWHPQKGIVKHAIDAQGKVIQKEQALGLALYYEDNNQNEFLITETPIVFESYLLPLKKEYFKIFGRSVDPYGNESSHSNIFISNPLRH